MSGTLDDTALEDREDQTDLDPGQDEDSGTGGGGGASYQPAAFRQTAPGVYSPTPQRQALPTVGARPKFAGLASLSKGGGSGSQFEDYGPATPTPDAAKEEDQTDWSDYAKNIWNSVRGTASEFAGLGEYVTREISGDSDLSKQIGSIRDGLTTDIQKSIASMTPAAQKALSASLLSGGSTDKDGNRIPTPGEVGWGRYAAMTLSSFVPDAALMFVPGVVAEKLALKGATMLGAGTRVSEGAAAASQGALEAGQLSRTGTTIARAGQAAGTGGYFAAQGAGEAFNTAVDEGRKASESDWMNVPTYARLRQQGVSDADARTQSLTAMARLSIGESALLGAVSGAAMGPLARGAGAVAGVGAASGTGAFIARRAIGAAEGAAVMGAQAGGDEAIHQTLQQELHRGQQYDVGQIARAGATGALGGAAMGGALGAHQEDPALQQALRGAQAYERAPMATPDRAGGAQYTVQRPPEPVPEPPPYQGPATPPGGSTGVPGESPPVGGARVFRNPAPMTSPGAPAEMAGVPGESPPPMGERGVRAPVEQTAPSPTVGTGAEAAAPTVAADELRGAPQQAAPSPVPTSLPGPAEAGVPASKAGEIGQAMAGMGKGIGASLRDMLWDKHQAGDTTEAGTPSNTLQAARWVGDQGAITDRASFDRFLEAYGKAQRGGRFVSQDGYNKFLSGYVKAIERERARAAPEVKPETPVVEAKAATEVPTPTVGEVPLTEATKAEAEARTETEPAAPKEVPEGSLTPEEQQNRELALEQLADARATVKVPRGTPVEKLVERAWQDLQARIGTSRGSRPELVNLLGDFLRDRAGREKPEVQARTQVAQAMLKRLGVLKDEDLKTQKVREARASEAEIQEHFAEETRPPATAKEPTSAEMIEAQATGKGEGESAGQVAGHEVGRKKALSKDTTDHERKAKDLLFRVEDGEIPLKDAIEQYGTQNTGKGRKRRAELADFPTALRTLYERGKDPDKESARIVQEMRAVDASKLAPSQKAAMQERLGRELDRVTDPEKREAFRRLVEEAEDPVKAAADKEAQGGTIESEHRPGAASDAIDPRSSRGVQMALDPRMDADLIRHLQEQERLGQPAMLHDLLRRITQMPLVRTELPMFRSLATRLLSLVQNVPVYTNNLARQHGLEPSRGYGVARINLRNPERNHIVIDPARAHQHGTYVGTLLHEAVHTVHGRYLHELQQTDPSHSDLQILRAIGDEIERHFTLRERAGLSPVERTNIGYALSNPRELHTMIMTDPVLQAWMASHEASPEFRILAANLGFAPRAQGRSLWRYFADAVRKALGLGESKSASETAFLDHVLQAGTDITDRAARYNERYLPKDPALRRDALESYWSANQSLGPRVAETARRIADRVDISGLGDRGRRALLRAMPGNQLVDRYVKQLPSLRLVQTMNQGIDAAGKGFADKFGDDTKTLIARIRKADNRAVLQDTMNRAGYQDAQLGPGANNDHILSDTKNPGRALQLRELQAQYNTLSPKDQAVYADTRDHHNAMYADIRQAQLNSLINAHLGTAPDAYKDAVRNAIRQGDFDDFLAKDPSSQKDIAHAINNLYALGKVRGDYFPLRRFGDYIVRYGDPDDLEKYGLEMYESRGEAERRRAELAAQGVDRVLPVARRSEMQDFEALAPHHPAVEDLVQALAKQGFDAGQQQTAREQLNRILVQYATRSERTRLAQTRQRRGVRGASLDQARSLAHDFVANTQAIGHLEYGLARERALQELNNDVHEIEVGQGPPGLPAVAARGVYEEMARRARFANDPDNLLYNWSHRLNALNFVLALQSPSHWVTTTVDAQSNAMAYLGARHGMGRSWLQLNKALLQLTPMMAGKGAVNTARAIGNDLKMAHYNMTDAVIDRLVKGGANRNEMEALFHQADQAGAFGHTQLTDYRREMMNPGSLAAGPGGRFLHYFNTLNAIGQHSVDLLNKATILKAAYDLEMSKGKRASGDMAKARDDAIGMLQRSMPDYTTANRQSLAQGPIGRLLLQFKRYGVHQIANMANLVKEMSTGENKLEATRAFTTLLATHAMTAGVITTVADPLRWGGGLYDWVTSGITGAQRPVDRQAMIQRGLSDLMGPYWANVVGRGLPQMAGIDLRRRVGMENMLEAPDLKNFTAAGFAEALFHLATGATGEELTGMAGGATSALQGDIGGVIKSMLPRPIRDVYKAEQLATKGVTDSKGETIMPPGKLDWGDIVAQGLGFQPSRVANFRQARNAVLEAEQDVKDERSRLEQRWMRADPGDRGDVMQEIRLFNQDPAHHGQPITMAQLHQQEKEQRKQSHEEFGLRLGRKAQSTLEQAGRFVLP